MLEYFLLEYFLLEYFLLEYFLLEFSFRKKPVQMFAYLISEVLCNIYQVCISTATKASSPDLPQRLDQERSLWKAFSKHRAGKLSAMCLFLSLLRR